jgi:hypothetical protein
VIRRLQVLRVVAHQVRYDHANSLLLVVEHDRLTARRAQAELERAVRILVVERHALQACHVVDLEIAVIEEHDVRRRLRRHALAHRAVARVIVDRILIGACVDVLASPGILRHGSSPSVVDVELRRPQGPAICPAII